MALSFLKKSRTVCFSEASIFEAPTHPHPSIRPHRLSTSNSKKVATQTFSVFKEDCWCAQHLRKTAGGFAPIPVDYKEAQATALRSNSGTGIITLIHPRRLAYPARHLGVTFNLVSIRAYRGVLSSVYSCVEIEKGSLMLLLTIPARLITWEISKFWKFLCRKISNFGYPKRPDRRKSCSEKELIHGD